VVERAIKQRSRQRVVVMYFGLYSVAERCYVRLLLSKIFLLSWDMGDLCSYEEKVGSQVGPSGSKCLCLYDRIQSIRPF